MNSEFRASLMGGLWFVSAIVLAALFISAAAQGELTPAHIALTLLILSLDVIGTLFLAFAKGNQQEEAKAKRQDMDSMLRDMSDDDLLALKQRLSEIAVGEETVVDYVSDDGELVMRS